MSKDGIPSDSTMGTDVADYVSHTYIPESRYEGAVVAVQRVAEQLVEVAGEFATEVAHRQELEAGLKVKDMLITQLDKALTEANDDLQPYRELEAVGVAPFHKGDVAAAQTGMHLAWIDPAELTGNKKLMDAYNTLIGEFAIVPRKPE